MPEGVVALTGTGPAVDARRQVNAALGQGDWAAVADLIAHEDPYPRSTLLRAVSMLMDSGRIGILPDLAPIAAKSKPLPARIWQAMSGYAAGDENALNLLRDDARIAPNVRASARIWAVYGAARIEPADFRRGQGTGLQIVQFWDKPETPADLEGYMAGWRDLGGRHYRCFDAVSAADFMADAHGGGAADMFRACRHPAIQADYFRLGLLVAEGGFYVDADSMVMPDMAWMWPALTDSPTLLMTNTLPWAFVQNCMIASPPGQPFLMRAFEEAGRRLRDEPGRDVLNLAGPHMLRDVFAEMDRDGTLGRVGMLSIGQMRRHVMRAVAADYKNDRRHWSVMQREERT